MTDDLISKFGFGAKQDPPDNRDYQAPFGAVTIDWSKEFRLPEPPNENQGAADDCVAHAWSFYHWQLHGKNYSRRDLFSRIALDYGAYIRDGGLELVKNGQATRDEVSDPKPETPQNMRSATGTKQEYRDDDKEINSFVLPQQDINGVAWGVQNYKGVVFGVNLSNEGWANLTNPRPPQFGEKTIGHALYGMGAHMHDSQKCIIAKSSLGGATEHHIKENYFLTGNTFNAWTLIPKEQQPMFKVKKVKINSTYAVLIDTPNGTEIIKATSEDIWRSWSKGDSYQLHTVNADGSTDWTVDLEINF